MAPRTGRPRRCRLANPFWPSPLGLSAPAHWPSKLAPLTNGARGPATQRQPVYEARVVDASIEVCSVGGWLALGVAVPFASRQTAPKSQDVNPTFLLKDQAGLTPAVATALRSPSFEQRFASYPASLWAGRESVPVPPGPV